MEEREKYADLKGAIRAKFRTQQEFAQALNMHPSTLSSKLSGTTQWAFAEVATACEVLGIPLADAANYFFG